MTMSACMMYSMQTNHKCFSLLMCTDEAWHVTNARHVPQNTNRACPPPHPDSVALVYTALAPLHAAVLSRIIWCATDYSNDCTYQLCVQDSMHAIYSDGVNEARKIPRKTRKNLSKNRKLGILSCLLQFTSGLDVADEVVECD